jgi:hypothetical protein
MENMLIPADKRFYMTQNKSSFSLGVPSEPFHHTFSMGVVSKIFDYHVTDHPDTGEKRNRYFLRHSTADKVFEYMLSEEPRMKDALLSGIKMKQDLKWKDMIFVSCDGDDYEGMMDYSDNGNKIECSAEIKISHLLQKIHDSSVFDRLKQVKGFLSYEKKGNDLHYQGIVLGLPRVKGCPVKVLVISKRQIERWGNRLLPNFEKILELDTSEEQQAELKQNMDTILIELQRIKSEKLTNQYL